MKNFSKNVFVCLVHVITILGIFSLKLLGIRSNIEIGYYSAAFKVTSLFLVIMGLFCQSLMPYLRDSFNRVGRALTLYKALRIYAFVMLIYLITFVILKEELEFVIILIFGKEYFLAANSLSILMWGVFGSLTNFLSLTVLQSIGEEKIAAIITVPGALLNVILCYLYFDTGAAGVAQALSTSLIFTSVLYIFYFLSW